MKPIELSKDQREKLLEMIQSLFPDNWDSDDCYISDNGIIEMWNVDKVTKQDKAKSIVNRLSGVSIHWFEFCMVHLSHKIGKAIYGRDMEDRIDFIQDMQDAIMIESNHPVEYLYERFKEIK